MQIYTDTNTLTHVHTLIRARTHAPTLARTHIHKHLIILVYYGTQKMQTYLNV